MLILLNRAQFKSNFLGYREKKQSFKFFVKDCHNYYLCHKASIIKAKAACLN
jgi:hypothetical protein